MNTVLITTTSLILGALVLPFAIQQESTSPGGGQYSSIVEIHEGSPMVQNVPVHGTLAPQSRVIDLAICLDTSGSMSGLIDSVKQRLWTVVNDLALADPAPELRVALLTFGNDGHDPENGWVHVDSELTGDLDIISQQLFALSTNGGTELVGRVVSVATGKLNWSTDPHALKIAIVAGNESADQDSVVSFRSASVSAIGKGIMVNSIYCGAPTDGDAPLWKEVSLLADGHFATIDHQNGTLAIATPFDDQLAVLTGSVNGTYLPFGANGMTAWGNQVAQDGNAIRLNGDALSNRAMCKNGALYICGWDLVDASKQEGFELAKIEVAELPEAMRTMTLEQRQAHIDEAAAERAEIQKQVAEVGQQRQAWLDAEMVRLSLDESQSFDHQVRGAIRAQVSARGFRFPKPASLDVSHIPVLIPADLPVLFEATIIPPLTVQPGPTQQARGSEVNSVPGQLQQGSVLGSNVQQSGVQSSPSSQSTVQQAATQQRVVPQAESTVGNSSTPATQTNSQAPASPQTKKSSEAPSSLKTPLVPKDC